LEFDILIKDGRIIDGSGNPWFKSDIGIIQDRIEAIGFLDRFDAKRVIDACNLVVSPGFIDIHGHSDYTVVIDPRVESKIRQGVTTEVLGQCGKSPAPLTDDLREYNKKFLGSQLPVDFKVNWESLEEYLNLIDRNGASFNVVALVGQGTVRHNVLGVVDRPPTESEMEHMKDMVAKALKEGAFGMSSGLVTTPSCYADTTELVELAKVVAEFDGVYFCHIRGEGIQLFNAINEALEIAKRSGVSLEIPHFKASGRENWGKTGKALSLIEEARMEGIDVTIDQYPWTASSIGLSALLPPWVHEGGNEKLLDRLKSPEIRKKIVDEPARLTRDLDSVVIAFADSNPQYEGMKVTDIARMENKEPMEAVFDLLIMEKAQVSMIYFGMSEDDVRQVMKSPYVMFCSDGRGISPKGIYGKAKPHPRYYGSFPRVLGHYVREGVISIQEAVRKMTSAPSQRLGLKDRGLLRENFMADITVFDPKTIKNEATYTDPHRFPTGIPYVIVNGRIVIDGSEHTGELPGKALRKG
jgi:N-acyl-D-amino-acid deacylase